MKFRERKTTNFLYIHFKDTDGLSLTELYREARRIGKLDIDYHYVIQGSGIVEEGRPNYVVAGNDLENSQEAIYVLVDMSTNGKLTDAQKLSLRELLDILKYEHPGVEIVEIKEG